MLPSTLVQLMLTARTAAPTKSAGVVTVRPLGSSVIRLQVPSPLSLPPFMVQPEGTPDIFIEIRPISPSGASRARWIGSPAIPAGARDAICGVPKEVDVATLPLLSITLLPAFRFSPRVLPRSPLAGCRPS
ncbi:hypothetical protein D3C72_836870 [compost metagenome]